MKYLTYLRIWLSSILTGKPHFVIGNPAEPYMLRWYLIPRNPWINLYLHKFLRSDDDRAKHDHPWWFVSLMIRGCYFESLDVPGRWSFHGWRRAPSIAFRRATDRHIVMLEKDGNGSPVPCWTIVLTGPKWRTWGFWCPKGFVPWDQFVDHTNAGNTGKGCGE